MGGRAAWGLTWPVEHSAMKPARLPPSFVARFPPLAKGGRLFATRSATILRRERIPDSVYGGSLFNSPDLPPLLTQLSVRDHRPTGSDGDADFDRTLLADRLHAAACECGRWLRRFGWSDRLAVRRWRKLGGSAVRNYSWIQRARCPSRRRVCRPELGVDALSKRALPRQSSLGRSQQLAERWSGASGETGRTDMPLSGFLLGPVEAGTPTGEVAGLGWSPGLSRSEEGAARRHACLGFLIHFASNRGWHTCPGGPHDRWSFDPPYPLARTLWLAMTHPLTGQCEIVSGVRIGRPPRSNCL